MLFEGFRPKLLFFTRDKEKHLSSEHKTVLPITYTPDFTFTYKDLFVVLEVKGFANDVFPYKFKMFRHLLEQIARNDSKFKYILVEIFTKSQLEEFIKLLISYDHMALNLNLTELDYCVTDSRTRDRLHALYASKNYEDMETILRKVQRARAKEVKASGGNAWKDDRYTKLYEVINSIALYTVRNKLLTESDDVCDSADD